MDFSNHQDSKEKERGAGSVELGESNTKVADLKNAHKKPHYV